MHQRTVIASLLFGLAAITGVSAAVSLQWVGNTYTCPPNGSILPNEDLWIYSESSPIGAGSSAFVAYNIPGLGTNWSSTNLVYTGPVGGYDGWHVDLGQFAQGTIIQFAVAARDGNTNTVWDTNNGTNYWVTVNGTGFWVGNNSQTPANGQVDPQDDLVIMEQTYAANSASTSVVMLSSTNLGTNWVTANMTQTGSNGQTNLWQLDLGKFPGGRTVSYYMQAFFASAGSLTDPSSGGNYSTLVNGGKPLGWIGDVSQSPANGSLNASNDLWVYVQSTPIGAAISGITVYNPSTMGTNWFAANLSRQGTSGTDDVWGADLGKFPTNTVIYYAMQVTGTNGFLWDTNFGKNYKAVVNGATLGIWIGDTFQYPTNGNVNATDDLWINTATYPYGAATSVSVQYSVSGGSNWTTATMYTNGTDGTNNLWHADLGKFPASTTNEYAVFAVFGASGSVTDDNNGAYYRAYVNGPVPLAWIGYSYNYPSSGSINPGQDFWVNTETSPHRAATSVIVNYTTNGGVAWQTAPLTANGIDGSNGNDQWHVDLGGLPEGTLIQYAVEATDAFGTSMWDNNYFQNFYAKVNTLIRDVYTDKARYNPGDTAQISVVLSNANAQLASGQVQVSVGRLLTDLTCSSTNLSLFTPTASFTTNVNLNAGQGTTLTFAWQTWLDNFRGYTIDVDFLTNGVPRDSRSSALDVSTTWTKFPRYGWFTDFFQGETAATSSNVVFGLNEYHINVVQFYDWLYKHNHLLPYDCNGQLMDNFTTFDGRNLSIDAITNRVQAAKNCNMSPVAYDLMYGDSTSGIGPEHITWAAFDGPGLSDVTYAYSQNRTIWLMDVTNPNWQDWIFNQYADAMTRLGFEGIHLDNLGGSQTFNKNFAVNPTGWLYQYNSSVPIVETSAFPAFINACKSSLQTINPVATVTENDVYAGYISYVAPTATDVYYCEVWGWSNYGDIQNLIAEGKQYSNGKAVVLAAYMNYNSSVGATNTMNESSVRLMDATVFANGAAHVELGEGYPIQMLATYYWPEHYPPMPGTLPRVMRDYYDFIVRYENLLDFNTLGNTSDVTSNAITWSGTHALSKNGQTNTIWTVCKQWHDQYDAVSLINLYGLIDDQWRNAQPAPAVQTNIVFKYYLSKKVQQVYLATPDDGLGRPTSLAYTDGVDGAGYYVQLTVPQLQYWDLLIFDENTRIKVDGWPGDWQGTPLSLVHQDVVSQCEWIYTGGTNDFRTFGGASSNEDITQVRVTSDPNYVYFLIEMSQITDATLPAIGIAWNTNGYAAGSYPWIGDASTPTGSIGLTSPTQAATKEIMFYTAGGVPKIRLWSGAGWYAPPSADASIAVTTGSNAIEARINKNDLGVTYPAEVSMSLASFRSSGNDAGSNSTYNSPDNNNDAVDVMGGTVGAMANSWTRCLLSNNVINCSYSFVLTAGGVQPQTLQIPWPSYDGQPIYLTSTSQVYSIVAQFADTLPATAANFTFKINGVVQPQAKYYFSNLDAVPFTNEIRYDWSDLSTGIRTIEVDYVSNDISLQALRVVNLNPYSANDGIPDSWRAKYSLAVWPTNKFSCATCDADGTGQNNYFKYVAGLDPTNPASMFTLNVAGVTGQPHQENLTYNPVAAGRTYTVQWNTSPAGAGFANLPAFSGPITNGTQVTVTDTNAILPNKFYRMQISLP